MNNQQKQQVTEQVKAANNVLVAVSSNPTVDELAASVGLTLALNKLGKHATTVFSGVVPSTIEFLQPEKTIETTTDSLRDFIIALDKSKADKLRYKVEDNVVRIFITPYRTSITDKDLEFSQGDFNVDVVLALGVTRQEDLDKAITAHGRILHDATVISVSNRDIPNELGVMNWQDVQASSLCEMVASLTLDILPEGMDGQMATALLTGIIAETDRFKNEKTTPLALSLSSQLMSAGANQQLIAEKLDEPEAAPTPQHIMDRNDGLEPRSGSDGTLEIEHPEDEVDKIHIDEHGNLAPVEETSELPEPTPDVTNEEESPVVEIPEGLPVDQPEEKVDNTEPVESNPEDPEAYMGSLDDVPKENEEDKEKPTLLQPDSTATPMMAHQKITIEPPVHEGDVPKSDKPFDLQEAMASEPTVASPPPPSQPGVSDSLADLEKSVDSPHTQDGSDAPVVPAVVEKIEEPQPPTPPVPLNLEPPKVDSQNSDNKDPNAPPVVPPPMTMTPQFYDSDGNNSNPFLNPHQ